MLPVRVGHVWVKNWVWGFGEQAFKGHCAGCGVVRRREVEEGRTLPLPVVRREEEEVAAAAAARTAALGAAR